MLQISEKNYGSGKLKCSCFFQSENMPNLCPYKLVNVMLIKKSVIQLKYIYLQNQCSFMSNLLQNFMQNLSQTQKCICNQDVWGYMLKYSGYRAVQIWLWQIFDKFFRFSSLFHQFFGQWSINEIRRMSKLFVNIARKGRVKINFSSLIIIVCYCLLVKSVVLQWNLWLADIPNSGHLQITDKS